MTNSISVIFFELRVWILKSTNTLSLTPLSHLLAVIQEDTIEDIYTKVKNVIWSQSGPTIWVPSKENLWPSATTTWTLPPRVRARPVSRSGNNHWKSEFSTTKKRIHSHVKHMSSTKSINHESFTLWVIFTTSITNFRHRAHKKLSVNWT